MRIPLGARPPISNWWEKGVVVASIILILFLIGSVLHPVLVDLIYIGVLILLVGIFATICLGLYDSAREALEYAE